MCLCVQTSCNVAPALAWSRRTDARAVNPGNLAEKGRGHGASTSHLQVLTPRLARRHGVDWVQCAVLVLDARREEGDAHELLQLVDRRIALRVVVEAHVGSGALHCTLRSGAVDRVWQEVVVVLVGGHRVALELSVVLVERKTGRLWLELSSHHSRNSENSQEYFESSHVVFVVVCSRWNWFVMSVNTDSCFI